MRQIDDIKHSQQEILRNLVKNNTAASNETNDPELRLVMYLCFNDFN